MSSEVRHLLLDLDPYCGTDPSGMCPLFLERSVDVMAPPLSVMFRRLVRLGSFPACWRQANVTPIPNPPSSSVDDLWNALCMLPTSQFAYRKDLGTCDALLYMSLSPQSALESGQEARILRIDFSTAFDTVNHQGILYKLCSVGIRGSVLSILTQFLSNRSQHVMVDDCRRKLVDGASGVPQGSVLGLLLFLFTREGR